MNTITVSAVSPTCYRAECEHQAVEVHVDDLGNYLLTHITRFHGAAAVRVQTAAAAALELHAWEWRELERQAAIRPAS